MENNPQEVVPFTGAEFRARNGAFTAEEIPRLCATVRAVAAQAVNEKKLLDPFLNALAVVLHGKFGPLRVAHGDLDALPKGWRLQMGDQDGVLEVRLVAPRPEIVIAGQVPENGRG